MRRRRPHPKRTPGSRRGPPGLAVCTLSRSFRRRSGAAPGRAVWRLPDEVPGRRARVPAGATAAAVPRPAGRAKEAGSAARWRVSGARAKRPKQHMAGTDGTRAPGAAAEPCALVKAGEPHGCILNVWRGKNTTARRWKGPIQQPSDHSPAHAPLSQPAVAAPAGSASRGTWRPGVLSFSGTAGAYRTPTREDPPPPPRSRSPPPPAGGNAAWSQPPPSVPFSSAGCSLRRPLCGRMLGIAPCGLRNKDHILNAPAQPAGPSLWAVCRKCFSPPASRL